MALSEGDIVRFSRQILLTPVGGRGQEALGAASTLLGGAGSAQAVAGAYLAAGGSPVVLRARPVEPSEVGFLFTAEEVGEDAGTCLKAALMDVLPEGRGGAPPVGRLGELPAGFAGEGPWVALGWVPGSETGVVVYRTAEGCPGCFEETAGELANGPARAISVLLGAAGALAYQRLVLGLSEPLGAIQVSAREPLSPWPLRRCGGHR